MSVLDESTITKEMEKLKTDLKNGPARDQVIHLFNTFQKGLKFK